MSNIKVTSSSSNISVRIGQENAVRVLSSAAGGGQFANLSENVVGGIASVTQLSVSGISTLGVTSATSLTAQSLQVSGVSTFVGLSTFSNDLYVGGFFSVFNTQTYGVAYFDQNNFLRSTEGSSNPLLTGTNLILTTNASGVPSWSNAIDGGTY